MKRPAFFNNATAHALASDAPRDAIKIEFANRLQARMIDKGYRQSDLARAAAANLPKGTKMGRDSISLYIRGKSLPSPTYLTAIAQALDCKPEDLMPVRGLPTAQEISPPLDVREMSDGNVWLRINQAVPWSIALEVMTALKRAA
jgi:transcriptional regulator with XRE-family HTH domain